MADPSIPADLEWTAILLGKARQGEQSARERLARRYLPNLRVFARGRLPRGARSLEETDDLVQVAMIRGFARIDDFVAERRGSFLVYLRVIVDNLIRDRWRSDARRPESVELPDDLSAGAKSPLDEVVAGEDRERYERALQRLKPRAREAVILRFELDCSYEDVAEELGIASANAARMVVERALLRLAKLLEETPRVKPRADDATDSDLETLAHRMANGDDIDWEAAKAADPNGSALAGLSVLDRISRLARSERRALTDMTRRPRGPAAGADESERRSAATLPGPSGAMADPDVPTTWGPLELIEKIGEGSYGEVFRAHDPALRVDVALKLWFTRWSVISDMDDFLLEARTQARIRHPNVLAVLGAARHADRVGMWTELLRGETLEAALSGHGFFGPAEAALIGAELCRALAAVHGAGLIHGDLKTRNVMRVHGGRIVLMDFGSVTEAGQFGASERDTFLSGTPLTMAPELLQGGAADATTDLYSLGVLLYRLVSGRYPIEAGNLEELIARHDRGERVPLRDHRPDLPVEFIEMVEKTLSPEPSRRFASAGAFEQALLRYVRAEPPAVATEGAAPPAADPPRGLHAYLTRFIGREREVANCLELLEEARLLTLTGVAGCGKTRLGLRIAEGQVGRIARGVWFVDLAPLNDPGRVAQTVAQTLGAGEERGKTMIESAGSHVGPEPALIVLDNCEHVLAAVASAAVALQQCPRLKIIATSREALGVPGETVFQVPSLGLPEPGASTVQSIADAEAVRLFMSCAALARPDFRLAAENAPAVAEICRRLDGIPLAIELAAARLKVLGPAEILAKLDDRFRLLTGGSRLALPRHQTLRETLRWSYDLLSAEERGLLRGLAVFAGGWTIEAAQRVCAEAGDAIEVLDLMSNLVDKSLVVVEHTARGRSRYRLLETVRQFALEKLSEAPEAGAIRDLHLEFFADYAETHAPERGNERAADLAACDTEHQNVLAALAWAERARDGSRQALRIVAAFYTYWVSRGHFTLGADHVAKALARPGLEPVTLERARANFAAAVLAFYRADPQSAGAHAETSLALSRALGDKRGIVSALNALANSKLGDGDVAEIHALYEESLAGARELDHKPSIAIALNNLANLAAETNDPVTALPLYQESVEVQRTQGRNVTLGLALANEAETLIRLDRAAEAKAPLIESLEIVRETRRQDYGYHAITVTGLLAERLDAGAAAMLLLGAADTVRQATGVPFQQVELEYHGAAMARLRAVLGEAESKRAWAEGSALSFDGSVDQALAWLERPAGAEHAVDDAATPSRRRPGRRAATPWP